WARATGVEGLFALQRTQGVPRAWVADAWYLGLPLKAYLGWKLAFTAAICAALYLAWRTPAPRRELLLACVLFVACFVEPSIFVRHTWRPFAKPSARFTTPAPATRWLQAHAAAGARVYPRVELFAEEFTDAPRVDPPNLTVRYGLTSAAGYEPL